MALTNAEFAPALAAAIDDYHTGATTEAELSTALLAIFNEWALGGVSVARAAALATEDITAKNVFIEEMRAWAAGTADGGPDSDGLYPFTDPAGGADVLVPSPAKLAEDGGGGVFITPADYADDASAAAVAALAAGRPMFLDTGATATVDLDLQGYSADPEVRWTYFQEVCKWRGSCFVSNNSRIRLRLAAGGHDLTVNRDADSIAVIRWIGANGLLDLDSTTNQETRTISGPIEIGARSGDVYTLTVPVTVALGAEQIVGCAVGLSNIKGDNDAEALSGCGIIKSIAPDRLSFTCDIVCPRTADLVEPTTINSADTDYGWASSRAIFWPTWITFDTDASTADPGWDGVTDTEEGVFQVSDGGRLVARRLAFIWRGSVGAAYHQDIFFGRDNGTQIDIAACGLVGAPEKLIRLYGDAKAQLDQCHLGGGGKGEMGVLVQNGAVADLVQCVVGGFTADVTQAGTTGVIRAAGCIIAAGSYGVRALGESVATTLNCRIVGNLNGVYAGENARIDVDNGSFVTYITNNTVGLTRVGGAQVHGDPTFSGNATNSNAVANLLDADGLWLNDPADGLSIKIGPNGTAIKEIRRYAPSINIAAVSANSSSAQTFTVSGLAVGDVVHAAPQLVYPSGLVFGHARVSAANTLELNLANVSGVSADQGTVTYDLIVYRT